MDLSAYRKEFPIFQKYTYLNTASSGLLFQEQLEYRKSCDEALMLTGSKFRDTYLEVIHEIKASIGKVFNCHSDRIGLIPNYSWGINALAESLVHYKNVMTVEGEYPSVTEPFKTRGYSIIEISRSDLSANHLLQHLSKNNIDILAISITQWNDGAFLTPEAILEIKQQFPDLIILADGTQSLGTAPFDFEKSGIDVMMASGYKWLMSGYGNGLVMMQDSFLTKIKLKISGNNTLMDRFLSGRNNIGQQWEPGHIDTLNFGTMKMGIEKLDEVGLDNIENHIKKLSLTFKTKLVNAGYMPASILRGKYHTGIILMPGWNEIAEKLDKDNIIVSVRSGIRFSFHFYNNLEDVNRAVEALKLIVR